MPAPAKLTNTAIDNVQNGYLKSTLASWWNSENHDAKLDFTYFNNIELVQDLPEEIVSLLQDKVSWLSLPRHMSQHQMPAWLSRLTELKKLEIPDYRGVRLDIKNVHPTAPYDVIVGGHIREVHASEQADVHHDAGELFSNREVKVHLYDQDGFEFYTENALGFARYTGIGPQKTMDWRVLNKQASFPRKDGDEDDAEEIVCRHISIKAIAIHQKKAAEIAANETIEKPRASDLLLAEMGTETLISANVTQHTENIYGDLLNRAPKNSLVGHSQWGVFFERVFEDIDSQAGEHIKDQKQMLLVLPHHAETFYFRAKEGPRGRPRFVLSRHDANITAMRCRLVTNNMASTRNWGIDKFMDDEAIKKHYGTGKNSIEASLFIEAPANLHERLDAKLPLFDTEQDRGLKKFLAPAESKLKAGWLCYLMASGLPVPVADILREVADYQDSEERMHALVGKNTDNEPGRMLALSEDHGEALENHNEILENALKQDLITKPQFFELLAAEVDGVKGRFYAWELDNAKALRADNKILKTAIENGWLIQREVKTLLSAKHSDDTAGRYVGLENGRSKLIEEDNEIIEIAMKKGLLTRSDLADLLNPTFEGWPGRLSALQNNCAEAIKADNKILLLARRKDWLENDDFLTILIAAHQNSAGAFSDALQYEGQEAYQEYCRGILEAYSENWLERGYAPEADAALDWMEQNCADEYLMAERKRLVKLIAEQRDPGSAKLDQFTDFLQAKSSPEILAYKAMPPDRFVDTVTHELDTYLTQKKPHVAPPPSTPAPPLSPAPFVIEEIPVKQPATQKSASHAGGDNSGVGVCAEHLATEDVEKFAPKSHGKRLSMSALSKLARLGSRTETLKDSDVLTPTESKNLNFLYPDGYRLINPRTSAPFGQLLGFDNSPERRYVMGVDSAQGATPKVQCVRDGNFIGPKPTEKNLWTTLDPKTYGTIDKPPQKILKKQKR